MKTTLIRLAGVFVLMASLNTAQAQYSYRYGKKTFKVSGNGYTYSPQSYYRTPPQIPARQTTLIDLHNSVSQRRDLTKVVDRLRVRARDVLTQMEPYKHKSRYRNTYRRMYEAYRDTDHLRTLVRQSRYRTSVNEADLIRQDLQRIDTLWRRVDSDMQLLVFGPDMVTQANRFETTLRRLMNGYGVRSQIPIAPITPPVYYPMPYGYGGPIMFYPH